MLAYLSYKRSENVFFWGMSMAPWPQHCQHNLVLTLFFFQNKHYNRNVQPTFVILPVRTITSFFLLSFALFSLLFPFSNFDISSLCLLSIFLFPVISVTPFSLSLISHSDLTPLCPLSILFLSLFFYSVSVSLYFISFFLLFHIFSSLSMFCISFYHLESTFMLLSYFIIK